MIENNTVNENLGFWFEYTNEWLLSKPVIRVFKSEAQAFIDSLCEMLVWRLWLHV